MTWDQLRADYMTRYSELFLPAFTSSGNPGGFRWLMENGAVLADTHYSHVPLHTGPGHATVMTGASPRRTGIIGNSWYLPTGLSLNCVGDPDVHTIGGGDSAAKRGSSSPRNLLAATVGDELKLANNNQSKVIGMAIKDRGAILPTGHNADAAVWFDAGQGRWVTSSWYTSSTLPEFAQRANDNNLPDRWLNENWDLLLPEEAYKISMPVDTEGPNYGPWKAVGFPKPLSDDGKANRDYYNHLALSPYGNEMVFETAKLAVEYEDLGQDLHPDILSISFSTTDKIGHAYGPHSRESQDGVVRADRQLSNFLTYLAGTVPGGLDSVLIVLTADHGGAPLPEWMQTKKIPAKRVHTDLIIKKAEEAMAEVWPDKQTTGVVLFHDPYITFRMPVMKKRGMDANVAAEAITKKITEVDGIAEAFSREQILTGNLPRTREAQSVTNGFNPQRSGYVVVMNDPYTFNSRGKTGTTHGTSYNYDTHVPLFFVGKNVKAGVYTDRADVRDIAPTLSFLLGISAPASSEGRILSEIIR